MFARNQIKDIPRYCSVAESIVESFKEVKRIQSGEKKGYSWEDLKNASKKWEDEVAQGDFSV